MKTKTEHRMEKALHKIAEKIYWNFGDNFGYAFQGAPLTMFVYFFFLSSFPVLFFLKIRLWQDKYHIFKIFPSFLSSSLGSTSEPDKLYAYIKKACNV